MSKAKSGSWFLVGLFLLVFAGWAAAEEKAAVPFPPELQNILDRKKETFKTLLKDPQVLDAVRAANAAHANITQPEIEQLDKKWASVPATDPFIQQFMTNGCANRLKTFQGEQKGYAEIFIADGKGLNVCQTDKTSDYYQADEKWWINSFKAGAGEERQGQIEYDESSQTEAISVYIPVMDDSKAIGVAKVVVDIGVIKEEL